MGLQPLSALGADVELSNGRSGLGGAPSGGSACLSTVGSLVAAVCGICRGNYGLETIPCRTVLGGRRCCGISLGPLLMKRRGLKVLLELSCTST